MDMFCFNFLLTFQFLADFKIYYPVQPKYTVTVLEIVLDQMHSLNIDN